MVARRAHNPKVVGSNPAPATNSSKDFLLFKYSIFNYFSKNSKTKALLGYLYDRH